MNAVVDENVLIVANDLTRLSLGMQPVCPEANDQCRLRCAEALERLMKTGGVSLDDGMEVLNKYKAHCSFSGQPGIGDAFLRAVFERGYVPEWAERVTVRDGAEILLPAAFLESAFDNDDHIWVAISYNSNHTPIIINAVDSDYRIFRAELDAIGVRVEELATPCIE